MRLLAGLSTALLGATAFGCVDGGDEGRSDDLGADWRTGGKADGQTCDFDTMSTATYYGQFAYRKLESESGRIWYRIGTTWEVEGTLANGDSASLRVYFLGNDRVIAEYAEEHDRGNGRAEVLNQAVIITRASYDDATRAITIAGVGSGRPLTIRNVRNECMPGIDFTHSSDLISTGLSGDAAQLSSALTSAYVIDPDDLDAVPSQAAREDFEEDVANGTIRIIRM